MQPIYCISGLAADHRLFQRLSIPGYELVPLPWVAYDKGDDMASYATKMAVGIPGDNAIVIGLSFGGMLAVEMGKQHPGWKIFLVSSAKTSKELGYDNPIFRWISRSGIIPSAFMARPNFVSLYMLGARTREEKDLLRQVMKDADKDFYRWSLNAILHWDNFSYPPGITHIHGTADNIIPSKIVKPNYWITGGTHIMIYNKVEDVEKIISDRLR